MSWPQIGRPAFISPARLTQKCRWLSISALAERHHRAKRKSYSLKLHTIGPRPWGTTPDDTDCLAHAVGRRCGLRDIADGADVIVGCPHYLPGAHPGECEQTGAHKQRLFCQLHDRPRPPRQPLTSFAIPGLPAAPLAAARRARAASASAPITGWVGCYPLMFRLELQAHAIEVSPHGDAVVIAVTEGYVKFRRQMNNIRQQQPNARGREISHRTSDKGILLKQDHTRLRALVPRGQSPFNASIHSVPQFYRAATIWRLLASGATP